MKRKPFVERTAPKDYRIPKNIPPVPKFKTIYADPPWSKNQTGKYGACNHYDLMSLERIKAMPVSDLAEEDCHLWLWVTNGNIEEGLEVIKAWGFTQRSMFHWIKPKMGLGYYLRNASETCLFATRGRAPTKVNNQMNWAWLPVSNTHSEKPRELISTIERVSYGPYLELFCRKRPASSEKWYCWGNETEGGADLFIPDYPVPKYSFENDACSFEDNTYSLGADETSASFSPDGIVSDDGSTNPASHKEDA